MSASVNFGAYGFQGSVWGVGGGYGQQVPGADMLLRLFQELASAMMLAAQQQTMQTAPGLPAQAGAQGIDFASPPGLDTKGAGLPQVVGQAGAAPSASPLRGGFLGGFGMAYFQSMLHSAVPTTQQAQQAAPGAAETDPVPGGGMTNVPAGSPKTVPESSGTPSDPAGSSPSSPGSSPSLSSSAQMWDVWFDSKKGTKTVQRSPIVLDLNGNGKADITGSNIKGNGKIEGKSVKGFDLDPTSRQWSTKSVKRRPGKGAPALPKDTQMKIFDEKGELVGTKQVDSKAKKKSSYGLEKGQRAEFWDPQGRLVGELKRDGKDGKGKLMYFFGNKNENEWTKPWENGKGDGILAWDVDKDGKITSGKELFGEVDLNGKRSFKNGYEKLGAYFDKNKDGVVDGDELEGLKVWEDRNGDAVTQDGELIDAKAAGITSLKTSFDPETMGSSYGKA